MFEWNVVILSFGCSCYNFTCLLQAAAAKGEAPPGLPLKRAGQVSSDAQPNVKIHKNRKIMSPVSQFRMMELKV